jgi:steroid delta-isomerase-like uncharacterized protein
MTRDEMVALFGRRDDDIRRLDSDALAADHAEDAIAESPLEGRMVGRARIAEVYRTWFAAFPDLKFTTSDLLIDGDRAAQFFSVRATQTAPFGGVPPTNRRIDFSGVWLFNFDAGGLIRYDRRLFDVTNVLIQLGMLKGKPVDT